MPIKNVTLGIDDEAYKNWFSFEPSETIGSIDPGQTTKIVLLVEVPVGARSETITPNIEVKSAGTKKSITTVLTIKAVAIQFTASPSREGLYTLPKVGESLETITLRNSGKLAVENIDLDIAVACRDILMDFPYGAHVNIIAAGKSVEVTLRIKSSATIGTGDKLPCPITMQYDNPLPPNDRQTQTIETFLLPAK